jgi:hypothetical protein
MRITAQTTNGDLISSTLTDKKVLGEKLIEFVIIHQDEAVQLIAESNPQSEEIEISTGESNPQNEEIEIKETYAEKIFASLMSLITERAI